MESITDYFLRTEPDDIKRLALFKLLVKRVYFVMAVDTTEEIKFSLRDAGGEWVSYDDEPPANPLRAIVVRQSDGDATDSPYVLLEEIWKHCRRVISGLCKPDWNGLLLNAYITEQFAKEWEQAASNRELGADADSDPVATMPKPTPTTPRPVDKKEMLANEWPLKPGAPNIDKALSDVPEWLIHARLLRGAPGRCSSLWNPAMFAACLLARGLSTRAALTRHIALYFPEWTDEWKPCLEVSDTGKAYRRS